MREEREERERERERGREKKSEEESEEEREEEREEEIIDKRGRGQGQETVRYRGISISVLLL